MTPSSLNYQSLQKRKAYYIPLCCAGKISERKCAELLGMHYVSVHDLKKRYKALGPSALIGGMFYSLLFLYIKYYRFALV